MRYKRQGWQFPDVCPPDEDGVYIITDSRGNVDPAEYRAQGFGKTGRLVGGEFPEWRSLYTLEELYRGEVVAWRELPDPFEGEGGRNV